MANIKNFCNYLLSIDDNEVVLTRRTIEQYTGELSVSYNKSVAFTSMNKPFQNACERAGYRCVEADLDNDRFVFRVKNNSDETNIENDSFDVDMLDVEITHADDNIISINQEVYNINNFNIENKNYIDYAKFYYATLSYFYMRASVHTVTRDSLQLLNISDCEPYFFPNQQAILGEEDENRVIHNNLRRIFIRLLFHAQNSRRIQNSVKFIDDFNVYKSGTFDFNVKQFVEKFPNFDEDRLLNHFYGTTNKNETCKRYIKTIYESACYLKKFLSKDDPYEAFVNHVLNNGGPLEISNNIFGFKILSFDFLKELDPRFDYAKPDRHVVAVVEHLFNIQGNIAHFDYLIKVSNIIKELAMIIREKVPGGQTLTTYKLDKLLYIICSDDFYNHDHIENTHGHLYRNNYLSFLNEMDIF